MVAPVLEPLAVTSDKARKTGLRLSSADARHLLNLASQPAGRVAPQERQLALDMLTLAVPGLATEVLEELSERVCCMEAPPLPLVRALLARVPAPMRWRLLEEAVLPDRVLCEVIAAGAAEDRRIIAGRRKLGPAACAALAERADAITLRRLLENAFARPGDVAWRRLIRRGMEETALLAPMVERKDLPVAVAHEIFWPASTALRRRILLRFGSESAELERLLTLVETNGKRSSHESLTRMQAVYAALEESDWDEAIRIVSRDSGIGWDTARRILRDRGGEALLVLLKARDAGMGDFRQMLLFLQERRIARRWTFVHETERLEDLFGRISVNRARMALLYWEWRSRRVGPYADCAPLDDGAPGS